MSQAQRKAVFLDRDGTLNIDREYVGRPADVELVPGAAEGAKLLADAGFALIVASNQSGIARGFFTPQQADAVDARVRELLAGKGVRIEAMYRCPHLPNGTVKEFTRDCDCRKPKPGLFLRAARDLDIALARSWAIGNGARDIEAGVAAGCRSVLVNGADDEAGLTESETAGVQPDFRARDLVEAARFIVSRS